MRYLLAYSSGVSAKESSNNEVSGRLPARELEQSTFRYTAAGALLREIESSLSSYLRPPRRFGPADRNSSINTIREVGCSATEMAA